jgi:hypothetical protein
MLEGLKKMGDINNTVTCFRGVTIDGDWIGWLDLLYLYIQLVTTNNNTISDFHATNH